MNKNTKELIEGIIIIFLVCAIIILAGIAVARYFMSENDTDNDSDVTEPDVTSNTLPFSLSIEHNRTVLNGSHSINIKLNGNATGDFDLELEVFLSVTPMNGGYNPKVNFTRHVYRDNSLNKACLIHFPIPDNFSEEYKVITSVIYRTSDTMVNDYRE